MTNVKDVNSNQERFFLWFGKRITLLSSFSRLTALYYVDLKAETLTSCNLFSTLSILRVSRKETTLVWYWLYLEDLGTIHISVAIFYTSALKIWIVTDYKSMKYSRIFIAIKCPVKIHVVGDDQDKVIHILAFGNIIDFFLPLKTERTSS